jgi:dolichol-phosphate mannosyltransferase
LSVITPAYNEAENLPDLYKRLKVVLEALSCHWEWIVVDDHSDDSTFGEARRLAEIDCRVRVFRLSRNCGSHTSIICGLEQARGHCAVVMAADLQDPPELIPALLERWRGGGQVVWAVRSARPKEARSTLFFSRLYYWLMRNGAGFRTMPPTGADFFLIDRQVIAGLRSCDERNVSIFALIAWLGFRQDYVQYEKDARQRGSSGWTLGKKIKLVIDSLTAFSYIPIRAIAVLGVLVACSGLAYAFFVIFNAFVGVPATGWSSLMVVVLIMGGGQMCMLGVLGEYLWRALDESRHRPRYIVEEAVDTLSTTAPCDARLISRHGMG